MRGYCPCNLFFLCRMSIHLFSRCLKWATVEVECFGNQGTDTLEGKWLSGPSFCFMSALPHGFHVDMINWRLYFSKGMLERELWPGTVTTLQPRLIVRPSWRHYDQAFTCRGLRTFLSLLLRQLCTSKPTRPSIDSNILKAGCGKADIIPADFEAKDGVYTELVTNHRSIIGKIFKKRLTSRVFS